MSPFRWTSISLLVLLLTSGVSFALPAQAAPSLSVTISSPASGAVFNRGEIATITASVTSDGSPVSGATVTATNPTGAQITLSATSTAGTYSGLYSVQATDPVGTWTISVQAVSNGKAASASTTASVSGSLLVSVTSPAAGSKFNIGETATVDATVTDQDGTPVPSPATVSFVTPSGKAVPMSVDTADLSGRTWTGSYTIQPSDVAADGATWTIITSASYSGNTGSGAQAATLFKSLVVGVSTYGTSGYTTPQTNFIAGQTIYVKASVGLHDGTPVTSGTVSFTITGTTISSTSMPMTYSLTLGAWTGSYTVLSTDQQGAQTVNVTAADGKGNTGSGTSWIMIGAQALTVTITSPAAGTTLNRGEPVTITASVSAAGTPATSATVTANSPSGSTISLANLGSGIYSASYTVLSTDPIGTWVITTQATQSGLSGSAQVAVTVSDELDVAVSTWSSSAFNVPQSSFIAGQTVFVKAQVSLQDGAPVTSGTVTFEISGTSIASSPIAMTYDASIGAWVGSYTILASDQAGTQTVTATASDGNGNSGSGTQSMVISSVTPPTSQPLEAEITLNPMTHEIQVDAVCNTSAGCTAPATVTNPSSTYAGYRGGIADYRHGRGYGNGNYYGRELVTYVIKDSAGHSLVLKLSVNRGEQVGASVLSIQYGSAAPVRAGQNSISFELSPSGHASLVSLVERASADGTTYRAHFDAKNDITTITTAGSTTTEPGLWLLELATSYGTLSVTSFEAQAAATSAPSTSVTSMNCMVVGQQELRCSATVYGVDPTGQITWTSSSSGTFSSTTCALGGGDQCEVTYTAASSGVVTITASYSGDSNNLPSSATVTLDIT